LGISGGIRLRSKIHDIFIVKKVFIYSKKPNNSYKRNILRRDCGKFCNAWIGKGGKRLGLSVSGEIQVRSKLNAKEVEKIE
jgi:hypothetical protein